MKYRRSFLSVLSTHKQGWKIYRSLDVEYVLVVFGGVVGYPSDDINKFLWMVGALRDASVLGVKCIACLSVCFRLL